jgi:2-C-methyl-D-erythritol 4-phosphate cytidylyltransferase
MNIAVIIPAAGTGSRFQTGRSIKHENKVELDMGGRPAFERSVDLFMKRDNVCQIIMAVRPDELEQFKFKWGHKIGFLGVKLIAGGTKERWETVMKALQQIDPSATHVAIHDAVRPVATRQLVDKVFEAAEKFDAVIPAVPVSNTLKRVEKTDATAVTSADRLDAILGGVSDVIIGAHLVVETVDRHNLVEVQTPQVFKRELIEKAYAQISTGKIDGKGVTDDAMLVEKLGEKVWTVEGEVTNLKITTWGDAEMARAIAAKRDRASQKELAGKRLFKD